MDSLKRKKRLLKDRKNIFVYAFWNLVNKICISVRFDDCQVIGAHNIPKSGPFLLFSNHITRWDGLIVYELIGRPANFMVSPNELLGVQGEVLSSMGSFPADPKADLIGHSLALFAKGEGIVVFPEGNIFRDGSTHPFKTGAAKICLAAIEAGYDVPLIPAAIQYANDGRIAQIVVGEAINARDYLKEDIESQPSRLRLLSDRMHREVCHLRQALGNAGDNLALFVGSLRHRWTNYLKHSRLEDRSLSSFKKPELTVIQSGATLDKEPAEERKVS